MVSLTIFSCYSRDNFSFAVSARVVFQEFLKRVLSGKEGLGDVWHATRAKLLNIYREALSSNCAHLVEMVQVVSRPFYHLLILLFASLLLFCKHSINPI